MTISRAVYDFACALSGVGLFLENAPPESWGGRLVDVYEQGEKYLFNVSKKLLNDQGADYSAYRNNKYKGLIGVIYIDLQGAGNLIYAVERVYRHFLDNKNQLLQDLNQNKRDITILAQGHAEEIECINKTEEAFKNNLNVIDRSHAVISKYMGMVQVRVQSFQSFVRWVKGVEKVAKADAEIPPALSRVIGELKHKEVVGTAKSVVDTIKQFASARQMINANPTHQVKRSNDRGQACI